jgi:prepilin-type N-terminal cleavage/methylation domain-containing protein
MSGRVSTMRAISTSRRPKCAFTLIELLVVVAIISLLISILLPSLRRAREEAQAVACMSNERQILFGIYAYQEETKGAVPDNLWSENSWGIVKSKLWFYGLVPRLVHNPDVLICPADPFGNLFDFEAVNQGGEPHMNARVPSCGYGINYLLRHFREPYSFNIEKYPPTRPEETILMAEVGPDDEIKLVRNYTGGGSTPWRDAGRLIWDDGNRPWDSPKPLWLTTRHFGSINMAAMDLSVKRVPTVKVLESPILQEYDVGHPLGDCKGGDCYFCNYHPFSEDRSHYNFSFAKLYWWTGPAPRYPG